MHLPEILGTLGASLPPMAIQHLPQVRQASFGVGDSLFLVVIALVVFGPKKLPEISRQIGKLVFEFRKASNDFKLQIEDELRASEQAERQKQLSTQAAEPHAATPVALSAEETVSTDGTPTLQPPSLGETVSAQPPNRAAVQVANDEPHPETPAHEANREAAMASAVAETVPDGPAQDGAVQNLPAQDLSVQDSPAQDLPTQDLLAPDVLIEDVQEAARAAEEASLRREAHASHQALTQQPEDAATHHG